MGLREIEAATTKADVEQVEELGSGGCKLLTGAHLDWSVVIGYIFKKWVKATESYDAIIPMLKNSVEEFGSGECELLTIAHCYH